MAEQKINPLNRKFLKRNLSDAIVQSVSDVNEADIDISELVDAIDNEPTKLIADGKTSETALNQLANDTIKGVAIPGQSLVNDPKNPYPWEKPAKFANPRDAIDAILTQILQPEAVKEIINVLVDKKLLQKGDLRGAKLRGADLYCANLKGAKLRCANFQEANLTGANLQGARLTDAKITPRQLSEIIIVDE